jgi:citrate synthase
MDMMLNKIKHLVEQHDYLTPEIIRDKDVKLGLRNPDGTGVVVGITTKGLVTGYEKSLRGDDKKKWSVKAVPGKLYYCGYDVEKIIDDIERTKRFGFEEVIYLLLTGELPNRSDLDKLNGELAKRRPLSKTERKIIMEEVQNENQMYALHSVISHMSRCDPRADSTDIGDVLWQSLNLIAKAPNVVASNYNALKFFKGSDLIIARPKPDLSTAGNFLYLLTGQEPDPYEAHIFDIALVLHAEHGGGNNSTFTVRTVSSSGANTYMAIAAGIASLSGHLHGGANESVKIMMRDLKKKVRNWESDRQISAYLAKILEKKTGDGRGKIYGFGHAVYTISDPRAIILKRYAMDLAEKKGALDEFHLYHRVEEIATKMLSERAGKTISSNVDYYSGFLYTLMGIPAELFTPIFAMARLAGWSAHRLEQIVQGKIIRPAYIPVRDDRKEYTTLARRK